TRIGMQQKRYHHARIKWRLAQPTHVAARDRPEIQALPRQPNDKTRDVVLGHEVLHTRRHKQRLIDVPGAKVRAHNSSLNQTRSDLIDDGPGRREAACHATATADRKVADYGSRPRFATLSAGARGNLLSDTKGVDDAHNFVGRCRSL